MPSLAPGILRARDKGREARPHPPTPHPRRFQRSTRPRHPPPHPPRPPGLTTQSLRTIMVMIIWYWKYKGISTGGPTAGQQESRVTWRGPPHPIRVKDGRSQGQNTGMPPPRRRLLGPWGWSRGLGADGTHWHPTQGSPTSGPMSLFYPGPGQWGGAWGSPRMATVVPSPLTGQEGREMATLG